MLERVCVFTLTGAVLWSFEGAVLREDVISGLVRDVLLPSKAGANERLYDSGTSGYVVRWAVSNAHGVVAAVVVERAVNALLPYAESLVVDLRDVFIRRFGDALTAGNLVTIEDGRAAAARAVSASCAGGSLLASQGKFSDFSADFFALLARHENRRAVVAQSQRPTPSTPARAHPVEAATPEAMHDTRLAGGEDDMDIDVNSAADGEDRVARIARLKAQACAGKRRVTGPSSTASPGSGKKQALKVEEASKKEARKWGDGFTYSEKEAASLDRSKDKGSVVAHTAESTADKVMYSGNGASRSGADLVTDSELSTSSQSTGWLASAASLFSGLAGGTPLTRADLVPVVDSLRTLLQGKNVATEVADALVESVAGQLEGTKLDGSILNGRATSRTTEAVTRALRDAIERVLTPTSAVDILREVRQKRASAMESGKGKGKRDPYVIVFCGVNGVGKSTTLSKIAFHLKDHGHSVLLAACDSFRAGAVEQLKKHAERLDILLHESGYAKDPVAIAAEAIHKARDADVDVVLVDTAGRMQDNGQLMLQLAKLVASNAPDRVLFVGEALVGNDGVDQLMKFNRSLTDLAQTASVGPRIDGIVLTKFDTVDDKVGAALSMTYKTGIPIVFLGVGQQYPDLRKLNTAAVVKALLAN